MANNLFLDYLPWNRSQIVAPVHLAKVLAGVLRRDPADPTSDWAAVVGIVVTMRQRIRRYEKRIRKQPLEIIYFSNKRKSL